MEWGVQMWVRQCGESLVPSCMTLLKSASTTSLHLSFHPHISLPYCPKRLPPLHTLMSLLLLGHHASPQQCQRQQQLHLCTQTLTGKAAAAPHLQIL